MTEDEEGLAPQEAALRAIGVSRTTLWRARKAGVSGAPSPIVICRRLYWRVSDLPALQLALARFGGRSIKNLVADDAPDAERSAPRFACDMAPEEPTRRQGDLFETD
jgi:hypothetical protein